MKPPWWTNERDPLMERAEQLEKENPVPEPPLDEYDMEVLNCVIQIGAMCAVVLYAWWTVWKRKHPISESVALGGNATPQAHIRP